jgi:IclR family acetate operon transcriptional repressor
MKLVTPPAVKSASRVLDLLEYLGEAEHPCSFMELSRDLRIPKSSLFHLLGDLTRRGYVHHMPEIARYRLGSEIVRLARRSERPQSLTDVVTPVLKRLNERLNETNAYYVVRNNQAEVIATESGKHPLTYQMRIGDRGPLYAFSAGKVALSHFSGEALDYYFATVKRQRHTSRTICDEAIIRRELQRVRSTGFGYSHGELIVGVVGTARAVLVNNVLAGVLNISVPDARLDKALKTRVKQELVITAQELSTLLSE